MIETYFTFYLLIVYTIFLIISFFHSKLYHLPIIFPFFFFFFKPFISRLIIYLDLNNQIATFDSFSLVSAFLFPITFIYFFLTIKDKRIFFENTLSKLILLFVAIYFFQIFNPSTTIMSGLLSFKNFFMIYYIFMIPTLMHYVGFNYEKQVSSIIIIGIVYLTYGLTQITFGFFDFEVFAFIKQDIINKVFLEGAIRPVSFAGNFQHFFYFVVTIFLFLLPQRKLMNPKNKFLFNIFAFLLLILFINTPDRTPVLMLIIGLVSIFVFLQKDSTIKSFVKLSPLLFFFILIGRFFALPILNSANMRGSYFLRLLELFDIFNAQTFLIRYSSTADTQSKWSEAISNILNNIIFGSGTGSGTFNRISSSSDNLSIFVATHSDYLSVALETGILGLIIFVSILFLIIKTLLKMKKISSDDKLVACGIFASLLSLMACAIVNVPFFIGESRIIWLFIGIIPLFGKKVNFIKK